MEHVKTMNAIIQTLETVPVVPLVQADDPDVAIATARALHAGGLPVVEVVFRTDRALECLRAVAAEVPDVVAGAGTVLSASQAEAALEAGARFIVSPGLDDGVVGVAHDRDVPVFPGIVTPSELQHAFNLGLDVVKFFPASIAGGIPALKALASVFRTMRFMPTDAIKNGDYGAVTALASEAVAIANQVRGVKH